MLKRTRACAIAPTPTRRHLSDLRLPTRARALRCAKENAFSRAELPRILATPSCSCDPWVVLIKSKIWHPISSAEAQD